MYANVNTVPRKITLQPFRAKGFPAALVSRQDFSLEAGLPLGTP